MSRLYLSYISLISPLYLPKALSKDEMLSMIRFGADAVFKSKGDDEYTDADIDTLIRRGEERSRLDDERFQQTANSLANFSLTGEG